MTPMPLSPFFFFSSFLDTKRTNSPEQEKPIRFIIHQEAFREVNCKNKKRKTIYGCYFQAPGLPGSSKTSPPPTLYRLSPFQGETTASAPPSEGVEFGEDGEDGFALLVLVLDRDEGGMGTGGTTPEPWV